MRQGVCAAALAAMDASDSRTRISFRGPRFAGRMATTDSIRAAKALQRLTQTPRASSDSGGLQRCRGFATITRNRGLAPAPRAHTETAGLYTKPQGDGSSYDRAWLDDQMHRQGPAPPHHHHRPRARPLGPSVILASGPSRSCTRGPALPEGCARCPAASRGPCA